MPSNTPDPRTLRPQTAQALLERAQALAANDPTSLELGRLLVAPLVREDRERQNNLIETLRAYYACGARVDLTADRLFLHRNSVRYRLDRIRSLLQMNIDEPQTIAALMFALSLESAAEERSDAG
jgi:DNA-binding PucR family transcriptional regulator